MSKRFRVIGLVGGVASGKSTVASEFEKRGAAVLDADRLAHEALEDPVLRERVAARFGPRALNSDGSLNRKEIAAIVFRGAEDRRFLESLVHPRVAVEIEARLEALRREGRFSVAVLDVPLLVEAGLAARCDATVFVDAPRDVRAERVRQDRGWTEEQLAAREAAQAALEDKRRRADFVLSNSGSREEVGKQVQRLLETLKSKD